MIHVMSSSLGWNAGILTAMNITNVGISTLVPTLVHDTHRLYSFISSGYFNAFYDRSTEEAVVHAHELLPFDAKCDW